MNRIKSIILSTLLILFGVLDSFAQDKVNETFLSTRVINSHSVEMVRKGHMDFRVDHKFGDAAGTFGGSKTMFGMDQIADVRIGFEYGITDDLNIALARSKGAWRSQLFQPYLKYRLMQQTTDNSTPFSVTMISSLSFTSATASSDSTSEFSYQNAQHRMAFYTQVMVARKFNDRLSMQVMGTYVHRNYVAFEDENSFFAAGVAIRYRLTKVLAIQSDYFIPFRSTTSLRGNTLQHPMSLGFEINTGGHLFHLNFTNNRGVSPHEYLPYTVSDVGAGEFRFGFNISRVFKLHD